MRVSTLVAVCALAFAAACGGKPAPEEPIPQSPPPSTTAPEPAPAPVDDSAERERLAAERRAREAAERARALAAELTQTINFDYDQFAVRAEDQGTLDRKAAILQANPGVRLRISGHADERGSDEYNLALGNRRAGAAKRYLTGKGVGDDRLEVISFGEERPAVQGSSEDVWARNRRDEFEIMSGGDALTAP